MVIKFDQDDLKALRQSIEKKWIPISKGCREAADYECTLCELADQRTDYRINEEIDCSKCVIGQKTGLEGCKGTPYIPFFQALWTYAPKVQWLPLARAELAFLQDLEAELLVQNQDEMEGVVVIKFDQDDLKALRQSIEKKWIPISKGSREAVGYDCPLCELANQRTGGWGSDEAACHECVIGQKTKGAGCGGTPYAQFIHAFWTEAPRARWMALARVELKFLQNLETELLAQTPEE